MTNHGYPCCCDQCERSTDNMFENEISDHAWDLYLRGCDDPRFIASEMLDRAADSFIREQDEMEARGGPLCGAYPSVGVDDEIPW